MLSALRRDSNDVEDFDCSVCGRPLLQKNSPCPYCKNNGKAKGKAVELETDEDQDGSPLETLYPAPYGNTKTNGAKSDLQSWSTFDSTALLGIFLTVTGSLGILAAATAFILLGWFQGTLLLQGSLLLLAANAGLTRLKKLEASTHPSPANEDDSTL